MPSEQQKALSTKGAIEDISQDTPLEDVELGATPRTEALNKFKYASSRRFSFYEEEEENEEGVIITKKIEVRNPEDAKPMNRHKRVITNTRNYFEDMFDDVKDIFIDSDSDSEDEGGAGKIERSKENTEEPPVQYRLRSQRRYRKTPMDHFWTCLGCGNFSARNTGTDKWLISYLHWTFRASFFSLFISSLAFFMMLIVIFSGFIYLAGTLKPTCVVPNHTKGAFADAFTLSWTTFSTVGYGNTYPRLASQEEEEYDCSFITFITSMESFVGILYAGFCGAVLFGKVVRIQSQAQVIFSDSILVQYGRGVLGVNEYFGNLLNKSKKEMIPCPVLEFRLVNRLFDHDGGEIIDASLNLMAVTAVSDDKRKSFLVHENFEQLRYTYAKLDVDLSDHPYFKNVWRVRHTLDENSALLTTSVRELIKKNGGYWPPELNNYEKVRESLKFNQIVVNLSGTSNISAASVYAQKIYDDFDLSIGYKFVNIMFREKFTNRLMVDIDMIHDVTEQNGGGGEPLWRGDEA